MTDFAHKVLFGDEKDVRDALADMLEDMSQEWRRQASDIASEIAEARERHRKAKAELAEYERLKKELGYD